MPNITIEVRRQYSYQEELALMKTVHEAVKEAFKLPQTDRTVRLLVHEAHRFACPPAMSQAEFYTLISIDAFSGRSMEAKREMYRLIGEGLVGLGIPKDHIKVVLRESPRENWGLGGLAASDVDLGFKVEV